MAFMRLRQAGGGGAVGRRGSGFPRVAVSSGMDSVDARLHEAWWRC